MSFNALRHGTYSDQGRVLDKWSVVGSNSPHCGAFDGSRLVAGFLRSLSASATKEKPGNTQAAAQLEAKHVSSSTWKVKVWATAHSLLSLPKHLRRRIFSGNANFGFPQLAVQHITNWSEVHIDEGKKKKTMRRETDFIGSPSKHIASMQIHFFFA